MTNNPVQDAEPAMAEQGAHISRPGPTQAIAPMGNNRIGVVPTTAYVQSQAIVAEWLGRHPGLVLRAFQVMPGRVA